MTRVSPFQTLTSAFDDFLYAPLGDGANGTPISVLSALARTDRDPWEEAARLARLTRPAAAAALTSLITAAIGDGPMEAGTSATAAGLLKLLHKATPTTA